MSKCYPGLRWYTRKQSASLKVPASVAHWLFDASSLTARLIAHCEGQFRVELISVDKTTPSLDEIRALGLRLRSKAVIRQVVLYCDDQPLVFARTVIPLTSLRSPLHGLLKLGSRPLGAVLFADRTMTRSNIEVTCTTPIKACHPALRKQGAKVIWGRRSVFWLKRKPLLVSEFFLPALFNNGN